MDKSSVIRVVALIVVLINAVLALLGVPFVIPEVFADQVAAVTIVLVGLYTAFKNNYLTKKGLKQKEVLQKEKLTK